jgi:hypothetical protein
VRWKKGRRILIFWINGEFHNLESNFLPFITMWHNFVECKYGELHEKHAAVIWNLETTSTFYWRQIKRKPESRWQVAGSSGYIISPIQLFVAETKLESHLIMRMFKKYRSYHTETHCIPITKINRLILRDWNALQLHYRNQQVNPTTMKRTATPLQKATG